MIIRVWQVDRYGWTWRRSSDREPSVRKAVVDLLREGSAVECEIRRVPGRREIRT